MSFERPECKLSSAISKISKIPRLLSFRLNLICAKNTKYSKLNNSAVDNYFLLKLGIQRDLLHVIKC